MLIAFHFCDDDSSIYKANFIACFLWHLFASICGRCRLVVYIEGHVIHSFLGVLCTWSSSDLL
jgi:hypothetical protein